jgi:hypothetical protein
VAEPTPSTAFEPIPFYERLIALRTSDPEAFKRQTSAATIATLKFYERARSQAKG